ncbi:hypothetical protein JYU34_003819 [Plutella xylostella]|uniref:Uncharacterized protein n=1 Tax=Plutella xylostella TaxID=51655 RepID=A0ABQ7R104_PLUXY|nr:hypothetical protein JYU34_003819 [Plutella xylostella]
MGAFINAIMRSAEAAFRRELVTRGADESPMRRAQNLPLAALIAPRDRDTSAAASRIHRLYTDQAASPKGF